MKPILATDLDGTLIPASLDHARDTIALGQLRDSAASGQLEIVFVTGRHLESVLEAIEIYALPVPNWIIADVGSSIYRRDESAAYQPCGQYVNQLAQLTGGIKAEAVGEKLAPSSSLTRQEPAHQQPFKLCFYCPPAQLNSQVARIENKIATHGLPFGVIASCDPVDHRGLIDVLPHGVNKASALSWWSQNHFDNAPAITFAGDSGNDYAALTSEYSSIFVGNRESELVKRIQAHHYQRDSLDRLFIAPHTNTTGVLAGCRHFGLIK